MDSEKTVMVNAVGSNYLITVRSVTENGISESTIVVPYYCLAKLVDTLQSFVPRDLK